MAQENNFNKLILLKGFSTYFDRKIFYYSDYEDYEDNSTGFYEQEDINFNPNDGIDTSVDLSTLDSQMEEGQDALSFSYCLVLDKNEDIVSRWFIMDAVRTTKGIYRFELKRDVVAESIASDKFVGEAPIYVEKGILPDDDPMIVNDEGMNLNQIKKSEKLISYDNKEVGFIVGYFANDAQQVKGEIPAATAPANYVTLAQISTATGISASTLSQMINSSAPAVSGPFGIVFGTRNGVLIYNRNDIIIPQNFSSNVNDYSQIATLAYGWSHTVANGIGWDKANSFNEKMIAYFAANNTSIKTAIQDIIHNDFPAEELITESQIAILRNYEGRILYDSGLYKKIHIVEAGTSPHAELVISRNESTLFNNAVNYAIANTSGASEDPSWEIYMNYNVAQYKIELGSSLVTNALEVTIKTSHNVLKDAPYSMFVIPYGSVDNLKSVDLQPPTTWYVTKEQALALANDIALKLDDSLIDLQLLPFMPEMEDYCDFNQDTNINIIGKTKDVDYAPIIRDPDDPNVYDGVVIFPKTSSFSLSIPTTTLFSGNNIKLKESMKIDSQCFFYRLCSPNYNGVFEFNLAKDGGTVDYFLIDCTLKPFNPFIRVTPQFSFLYGQNFVDGRGLICGGDFSLPIIKDRWYNYELNNKNYSAIFARDIQNLDVSLRQERIKEPFTLAAGGIAGTAGGALAGAKLGGGYGAIGGAVAGAAAGVAGGIIDSRLNEIRRAENKDYQLDRFNLGLGNIKALPQSLTRVSSYSVISKIFPFLEFYSCTDEEVAALKRKIAYDGMTVGRIDYLMNFMGGNDNPKFFKGQLIRAEGIYEDNHFVSSLYSELAKGVYI